MKNMRENVLKEKTYDFAVFIVKTIEAIIQSKKEYVLSKQLLRSGTSIGAMVREAEFAQSRLDFINKMSIALKEANESLYWIQLMKDTNYINEETFRTASDKCKEIISMLVASIKTSKNNR